MAIDQNFKNYMTSNKDKLDSNKLKGLNKDQQKSLYNEWKSTGSISNSYFKPVDNKNTLPPTVKTTDNKSVVDSVKDRYNLGNVSKGNVMTDKVQTSISGMKETNKELASEKGDVLKQGAKEESSTISEKNKGATQRAEENQSTLDINKERDYKSNEARRQEADDLLKRQEAIAARQANIAAAKAGSSGLQMSDAAVQDIKDDIIAKYGSNLANAEQFRNQTNMSLDTALQKIDSDYFSNKNEVDALLNKLDDEEAKPLINAIQKATEGNAQAIDDVKTYYNTLVQKKSDEEMNRSLKEERLADTQKIWDTADSAKKLALLQDEFKEAGITDVYIGNPEKFANMTYSEAVNTAMKDQNIRDRVEQEIMAVISAGGYSTLKGPLKDIADQMGIDYKSAKERFDRTAEEKKDKVPSSESLTGTKPTVENKTFGLTQKTIDGLSNIISKVGVPKAIESVVKLYKNGTYTASQKDRILNYLNNIK